MKKIIICSIFSLFLTIPFTKAHAQGQLSCYTNSFTTCVIDLMVNPNPSCVSGYQLPDCSPHLDCCQKQNTTNMGCNDVACVPIGSTPIPTSLPKPTPDISTSCGNESGICRSGDTCSNWDEVQIMFSCGLTDLICCQQAVSIGTCPPHGTPSDATCRTQCLDGETKYGAINICGQTNQVCCLAGRPPSQPPIFCTSENGDPTSEITSFLDTGLGCVPFWIGPFTAKILAWAAVTTLGIAFIIIFISIGMFIISGGDSKKIQAAKELLMSAIGGIFLIIISLLLINYLGVNVLKINNLGFRLNSEFGSLGTFTLPTPRPTSIPVSTPLPTSPPGSTTAPIPTSGPAATSTPRPTNTPVPTSRPNPTSTPRPTTRPPTATPRPTSTPSPTCRCVGNSSCTGRSRAACGSPCSWICML